jgi:hypothetical protein
VLLYAHRVAGRVPRLAAVTARGRYDGRGKLLYRFAKDFLVLSLLALAVGRDVFCYSLSNGWTGLSCASGASGLSSRKSSQVDLPSFLASELEEVDLLSPTPRFS